MRGPSPQVGARADAIPNTASGGSVAERLVDVVATGGPERGVVERDLRYLADRIGPRPAASPGNTRARDFLVAAVKRLGFDPELQPFVTRVPRWRRAEVRTASGAIIPCLPLSPTSTTVSGDVHPLESGRGFPAGAIALAGFRAGREHDVIDAARRSGARGVLLWSQESPGLPSVALPSHDPAVPYVTVRAADAARFLILPVERVTITMEGETREQPLANVMVDVGNDWPTLVFLANYDSRSGSPGAYRNASGVAGLLALLARLRAWRRHRILVGFLDGEELGGLGSRHCHDVIDATEIIEGLAGIVYVSGLGRAKLAVCSDGCAGTNALVARAQNCLHREGFPDGVVTGFAPPSGVWDCPVVAVSGPRIGAEHTSADTPALLHTGQVVRAVNLLHRLARCV